MLPFLQKVAQQIANQYPHQLQKIAVVFPNRRQAVFFKNYLVEMLTPPAFLPELLTIEELVQRSSLFPIADVFTQSFALYDAYAETLIKHHHATVLDYEKFYAIAEILIRDFNELDSYLCNIPWVFQQLKDIEAIEKTFDILDEEQRKFLIQFWSSFSSEKKSVQQIKFLELWQLLPAIYQLFHDKLNRLQLTTQGLAYRNLATTRQSRKGFADDWEHVAFVGFNAFNKAEELLLQQWQQQSKASLWIDADEHYTANPLHEAGYFIRRNLNQLQLKNQLPLSKKIAQNKNPVAVVSAQGATAQAKYLQAWLAQFPPTTAPQSLAIILADEGLLLPVLQSIPAHYDKVNVTMGYPLQQSVLYSFIRLLFATQLNLAAHLNSDVAFEHVSEFLQHPLCDWSPLVKQAILNRRAKEMLMELPINELQGHSTIGNYFFSPLHNPLEIFVRILGLIGALNADKKQQTDTFLQGMLVQVWQVVQQLQSLFASRQQPSPSAISLYFLTQCLSKQLTSVSIPFEGEPLQGLQVMGLLESRGLDFENIIILNANEGSLPRIQSPVSFLPYSIRKAFGLSVPEHQDAIFAYAFYRLLHNCQHLTMVYNATITETSKGEVSRFVPQLAFETHFLMSEQNMEFSLKSSSPIPILIKKTKEVMQQCNPYFFKEKSKAISPSAINAYISCSLQYYFRYIANLKEPEEIKDEIDAKVFGSIVHKMMELLYNAVLQKNGHWHITGSEIEWMQSQIPVYLQQAFKSGWKIKNNKPIEFKGKLLIVAEVVQQYVNAYLQYDAANVPFAIQALETKFNEPFFITIGQTRRPIYLSGYIDRVDLKDGVYKMIDYKTGGDDLAFNGIEKLFARNTKKRNKAALQTLIYAWSFYQKFPDKKRFEPILLPLRKMQEDVGGFTGHLVNKKSRGEKITISADNIHTVLPQMEDQLRAVLEELFNVEIPFTQTDEPQVCSYCAYKNICQKK